MAHARLVQRIDRSEIPDKIGLDASAAEGGYSNKQKQADNVFFEPVFRFVVTFDLHGFCYAARNWLILIALFTKEPGNDWYNLVFSSFWRLTLP